MLGTHQNIYIQRRVSDLYNEFDKKYKDPVNQALSREESRFINANLRLNDEELLGDGQFSEISDLLAERTTIIKDHVRDISSDNRDKITEESEEMKDILEEIEDEYGE